MAQIPVYVNSRLVGVVANGELTQRRRASVHMLHRPRAWAVDVGVLREARAAGAVRVRIIDTETGANYIADIATFDIHGLPIDRGHGKQTALPIHFWRQQTGHTRPQADAVDAVQLGLFA